MRHLNQAFFLFPVINKIAYLFFKFLIPFKDFIIDMLISNMIVNLPINNQTKYFLQMQNTTHGSNCAVRGRLIFNDYSILIAILSLFLEASHRSTLRTMIASFLSQQFPDHCNPWEFLAFCYQMILLSFCWLQGNYRHPSFNREGYIRRLHSLCLESAFHLTAVGTFPLCHR